MNEGYEELNGILEKLDVEPFFAELGVVFRSKKSSHPAGWYADCPWCEGKKKLLVSGQVGNPFKCQKCGEKGNAISLYAKMRGVQNGEAVKAIKERLGIVDEPPAKKSRVKPGGKSSGKRKGPEASPPATGKEESEAPPPPGPLVDCTKIYNRFLDLTTLLSKDRELMHKKRGFTDATINALKFRSGGKFNAEAVNSLRTEFSEEELIISGLLIEVNGTVAVNNQLIDGRVIIPYLDEDGNAYHLRPHKLGFEGIPVQPYSKLLLKNKPEWIVLAEGEFKAVALWQMGIPALAIPGVPSFGGQNLDRLIELLRLYGVKQVFVIFDNEIKDNPQFKNFKAKPEDRYDTEYWTYMMAYLLGKEGGFASRAGKLPDEWRQEGKVDFDGALAAGRTKEEMLQAVNQSLTPSEYLKSLPQEAQRIVRRKLAKKFHAIPISREFNTYVAQRYAGGKVVQEETISNFVIDIKSSYHTSDGVLRSVQLVNEYGEKSDVFTMEPKDMAGLNEFKKYVFSKGNYIFKGKGSDLTDIWEYEFLRDMSRPIYLPDRIGWVDDGKVWLFGNMAIKDDQVYYPDNSGCIWIGDKGYMPQSLTIDTRGEPRKEAIPSLNEKEIDLKDIAQKMKQTIGSYGAYMAMGWAIATIFSNDIFARYKFTPILFVHGRRESGKTTLMQWIMAFFGTETTGIGIAETTQNFIARSLAYYSSLACWFDEYRNEMKVTQKDGFFRSAYNREFAGKGTATAFQAAGFPVRAAVAISGEEMPRDNGLFTRCIPMQTSEYSRDRTHFTWLNDHSSEFSYLTYYLLTHYEELKPKIMAAIEDLRKELLKVGVTDRTAGNWAICAACFDEVVLQDDEFIRWVVQECQEAKQLGENEHMLNQFWSDVSYLQSEGEVNSKHLRVEGDKLYIWLQGAYEIWAVHYRKKTGKEPFDRGTIEKYLQDEPYYKGMERKYFGGRQSQRRAKIIYLNEANEIINEIAENLENDSNNQSSGGSAY